MSSHRSFEQLIQSVQFLNQFEGHTDKEQLLELLHRKSFGASYDGQSGCEGAQNDENVEDIPAISRKTPSQTDQTNTNIDEIHKSEEQKYDIYVEILSNVTTPLTNYLTNLACLIGSFAHRTSAS